jgi:hypothetical protein
MQSRNVNLFVDDSDQDVSDIDKEQMEGMQGQGLIMNRTFLSLILGIDLKKDESFRNIFELNLEKPPVPVSKALELIDFTPKFKSLEFSGRTDQTPKPRQAKETMKLLEKIQREVN